MVKEPVMDETLLVKGKRFLVLKPGASIRGFRRERATRAEVIIHYLKPGDLITCMGLIDGLGPQTYGWTHPQTRGWVEPEFYPGRRTRTWGPMVPFANTLVPLLGIKEAAKQLDALVERTMLANDGDLPEGDAAINLASQHVVAAMHEERGEAWLGRTTLYKEETPELRKWDGAELAHGFNFVLPRHEPDVERLVRLRHLAAADGTQEDEFRVRQVFKRIRDAGGITLVWT